LIFHKLDFIVNLMLLPYPNPFLKLQSGFVKPIYGFRGRIGKRIVNTRVGPFNYQFKKGN